MRDMIQQYLGKELTLLGNEFPPNALAYLSLTGKNERVLCGALARRLHDAFANHPKLLVVPELPGRHCNVKRRRFDLAVLSEKKPVALIEAKAYFANDMCLVNPNLISAVNNDQAKLHHAELDGDRYVLTFFTHVHQIPDDERYDPALPYIYWLRKVRDMEIPDVEEGFERFHKAIGELPVLAQCEIHAGNAFDVDVSVLCWLFDANELPKDRK